MPSTNDLHRLRPCSRSQRVTRTALATFGICAAVSLLSATSAAAHVGVDLHGATATAGKGSTVFLRPGHGCDGDATNTISVTVPAGVSGAKAQQKAGWTVSSSGSTITWSGGNLPDDQFDDFGIKLTWPQLPAGVTSQKFYFTTVQTCNPEIKVTRKGQAATVTGALPGYAGSTVALFVDGIPLTKRDVVVGADGRFTVLTKSAKVPADSDVTATHQGRMIANSTARAEAWTDIPGASPTLDMPAPSVTVVAGSSSGS